MLRHLLERGHLRDLHLYWGAQTRADLYEDAKVREWCAKFSNLKYTPVLSSVASDEPWEGRRGWVHEAVLDDNPNLRDFDVYTAGPPIMVESIRQEFLARGLPADQLFFDSFDFAPDALEKKERPAG